MPNTEKEDPIRPKCRKDTDEPTWVKSIQDREEPNRAAPNTEREEDTRQKLRKEIVEPM
jgi:hypothetical protein